jgi:hypothetical protein
MCGVSEGPSAIVPFARVAAEFDERRIEGP